VSVAGVHQLPADDHGVRTRWLSRHRGLRLARVYPAVTVDPHVFYVDEGNVLTSAGVAAGNRPVLTHHPHRRWGYGRQPARGHSPRHRIASVAWLGKSTVGSCPTGVDERHRPVSGPRGCRGRSPSMSTET
jgi:hypothetical protein